VVERACLPVDPLAVNLDDCGRRGLEQGTGALAGLASGVEIAHLASGRHQSVERPQRVLWRPEFVERVDGVVPAVDGGVAVARRGSNPSLDDRRVRRLEWCFQFGEQQTSLLDGLASRVRGVACEREASLFERDLDVFSRDVCRVTGVACPSEVLGRLVVRVVVAR
jgi:hypothetical protein